MLDTITRLDDRVSAFSSRGPTWHDGFLKPDVVSPGENVLSVAAVGSRLRMMQELRGNTGEYMRLSGTSMAAGVTTGIIALTIDINPKLTPNALKAILEYSAIPSYKQHWRAGESAHAGCRPNQRRRRGDAGVGGDGRCADGYEVAHLRLRHDYSDD